MSIFRSFGVRRTQRRTAFRPGGRLNRLWQAGLAGLVAVASGATQPPAASRPGAAAPPQATSPVQPATNTPSPLDEPLRLIAEARQSYQAVRDYTCTLVKREYLSGQPAEDNVIAMKVRSQPFSVYLRWLEPKSAAGQEACYVAGRNNGMMRVHSPGLLGAVGFVSIDPRDPRALKASRHAITEAGIGSLIERCAGDWEQERRLNLTQVRVADYEFNKRRCTRVEVIHPDNRGGQFVAYRNVLYFDKETRLPIRVEVYDWPRQGGSPDGELIEVYSYVEMRFNVGLGDEAFNY
jgi:hypothetical protein